MSVLVGVGPQVNKFEQVSSDDHQMSLVAVGGGPRSLIWGQKSVQVSGIVSRGARGRGLGIGLTSDDQGVRGRSQVSCLREGVPYHVRYPIMLVMCLHPEQNDRHL